MLPRCHRPSQKLSNPAWVWLAVLTLMFCIGGSPISAEEPAADPPASEPKDGDTEHTVRMVFLNSTWPSVIRKVAEQSSSEAVMTRAPAGRFTRTDRTKYTRTEAVKILNEELEPEGFRLLEQGRYLVLLPVETFRSRYSRSQLSGESKLASGEIELDFAQPEGPPHDPKTAHNRAMGPPTLDESSGPTRQQVPRPLAENARALNPLIVDARRRGAKYVARAIFSALRPRAELIDSGPGNLPAFRVFVANSDRASEQQTPLGSRPSTLRPGQGAQQTGVREGSNPDQVQFVVGIDTNREQLLVEGSPEQRRIVAQLIRYLDSAQDLPGHETRLVEMKGDPSRVAEHLGPALQVMTAAYQPQPGDSNPPGNDRPGELDPETMNPRVHVLGNQPPEGDPRNPSSTQPEQPSQPSQPSQPGRNPGSDPIEPLLQLEGLRGSVTIQDVPGIGMVVTGNQDDVDAVVRIIRELEKMSSGVEADLQLFRLLHVSSEALAQLMNDVYEELTAVRSVGASQQPMARIIPIVRPNAILIIAGGADLISILDLVEQMDQPTDPRNEFQVFPLKSAVAAEVVRSIESMYEQGENEASVQGLRPNVRAVADIRTNSVIVQGSPRDLNEVALLIRRIDRDVSSSVSRMQVFTLKNAVAEELAEVINAALESILSPAGAGSGQAGGGPGGANDQSTQQLLAAKSVVLELLTLEQSAEGVVRSGILADIRVTADPRVNGLIVTAPQQSMTLMAALIAQLDSPSTNVAEIKVFSLVNSDAVSMVELLETLFSGSTDEDQLGVQLVGAEDASSGLIPIRFSVDVRTNSVIAIGGAEALRVVEAVILRLDQTDVRQRESMVLKLKNTSAELVAVSLNDFLQSQRDLASIDPELVSNVELLEQEIIVVAEPVSNSLLISTTPRYRKEILDIIETLDEAPDQVIIQVLIVEVVLENTDEFGVELGFQDSVLFDRSLINVAEFLTIDESTSVPATGVVTTTQRIVSQEGVPGFLFNNNQLGNNISPSSNAGHVASQGLSSFSLGRINGDLGFGGLVVSASSEAVSVLIRALSARREVQILSRPQIRTVDNQLAQIQVGQQVPVIQGVTTNALGGISPAIGEPEQIGIILQVTPRITPDGVIVMETIANKSAISGQGVPIITDPTTGAVVESPIFDVTEASATVAVPDGQTIVLGGMITKSDDILERKVPLLGDIPILGAAFRYDGKSTRRTELLIFMTPRIIRTDVDSELIKQVEIQRLHFLECEAEAMHGPISAVPPIGAYEGETIEVLPEGEIIPGHQGYDLPLPEEVDGIPTTVMPKLHDPGASYRVIQPHEGAAGSTEQPDGTSPANTEDQSSNIHRPDMMGSRAVISQSGATPQPGASLQPGRYPVAPAQYQGTSADRPAPVQQTGLQMPIAQGVQRATPNAKGRVDDSRPLVPRLEQELLPVANATGPQTSVRGPARFLPSNRTAASEPSSAGRNVPTGQTPR